MNQQVINETVSPKEEGVRLDRCGFGWSMNPALNNFGTSFGSQFPACDSLGGVPPSVSSLDGLDAFPRGDRASLKRRDRRHLHRY